MLAQDARQFFGDDLVLSQLQHEQAHDETRPVSLALLASYGSNAIDFHQ